MSEVEKPEYLILEFVAILGGILMKYGKTLCAQNDDRKEKCRNVVLPKKKKKKKCDLIDNTNKQKTSSPSISL